MLTRITIALLLASPLAAAGGTSLDEATKAFQKGDYAAVLELAGSGAAGHEDAPRLGYLAGETHLLLGAPEAAHASFARVLEARPKAVPARVGLGRALTALGRLDEAAAALDTALEAEPEDVGARIAKGELLGLYQEHEAARELLAPVVKADPGNPFAARALVQVLLRAERIPDAAAVAEGFAAARPEHPIGPFLLAVVMERDGEDELAIEGYRHALELDPRFLDAHKNLAILCHTLSDTYKDKERTELAFAHYERYFELGGADPRLKAMHETLLGFKEQILGS